MTTDQNAPDPGSYLAEPGAAGGGPGVLVVHDWYGLLPSVRERCDALAAAGFVALAPDLYDGRTAGDDGQGEEYTYPGTAHSFANADIVAKFAPGAAATAWTRSVAFLKRHLQPDQHTGETPVGGERWSGPASRR